MALGAELDELRVAAEAGECSNLLAGRGVPETHRPFLPGARDQAAIGAEPDKSDERLMFVEGDQAFSRRQIPDLHRPVAAGAGQPRATRAERDRVHSHRMPFQDRARTGLRVPDSQVRARPEFHSPIISGVRPTTAGEPLAVGAEGHAIRQGGMRTEVDQLLASRGIPDADNLGLTPGDGQPLAVGTVGE